jgi:hypothetical protein
VTAEEVTHTSMFLYNLKMIPCINCENRNRSRVSSIFFKYAVVILSRKVVPAPVNLFC